ncbi:MAG: division/cell wall cluster transcriptional repressor MraZ [Bacteroidaceae bacterium]|nr:division/cell wall cluster transcriptional repressor MraZ [Bacteroidaceae bacterium]
MRFIGNIEAKTDNKGRVFLPASFRRILQSEGCDKIMLRKDVYQDCLVLYPVSSWNEQLNLLRSRLDKWNSKHQMIFRQFVADVEELNIDSNGRILLPKRYLAMADIKQEVRFIGMDDTIEIWAKEKVEKPFMTAEEFGSELEKIMTLNNSNDYERE